MLRQLFDKYKCDKGHRHGYEAVYEPDFEKRKDEPVKVLEIGIFKGASAEAFVEYFPNGTIYGLDVFTRLVPEDIPALNHERVEWLKGDSTSISVGKKVHDRWGDIKFDIIIDDGLHTPEANAMTFKYLSPFLAEGGAYYIEDVWPIDIMTTKEMNHDWVRKHPGDYNILAFERFLKELQGWNVEKFDLRKKSGAPDSYIYKMTK